MCIILQKFCKSIPGRLGCENWRQVGGLPWLCVVGNQIAIAMRSLFAVSHILCALKDCGLRLF